MALSENQYRQRERTIPPRLIELATARSENPRDIPPLSAAVATAVLNKYLVGHTELAEMQIELILELADRCNVLEKQLHDLTVMLPPLMLPPSRS